jgi:hypothetical protein
MSEEHTLEMPMKEKICLLHAHINEHSIELHMVQGRCQYINNSAVEKKQKI